MNRLLTKKRLLEELIKLNFSLPPRKPAKEVEKLTELYFEDLQGKTEIHVIAAIQAYRRGAIFFPKIKHLLEEYDLVVRRVQNSQLRLPGPAENYLSPEENIKQAKELKQKLRMIKDVPLSGLSRIEKRAHMNKILKQKQDIKDGVISI